MEVEGPNRVLLKGSNPTTWHYTGDVTEAVAQARAMAAQTPPLTEREKYFSKLDLEGNLGEYKFLKRDSPINGSVNFTFYETDLCVVDEKSDPDLLKAYDDFIERFHISSQDINYSTFLQAVLDYVKQEMPYDTGMVEIDKLHAARGVTHGTMIKLGEYLKNHIGVCRQQAMLAGYIIEKAIKEGLISGSISVDRNLQKDVGGHQFARATDPSGIIYIVDPAQNYCGPLTETDSSKDWPYWRPTDFELFQKNEAKKAHIQEMRRLSFASGDAIKVRIGQNKYKTCYIAGDISTTAQYIPIRELVDGNEQEVVTNKVIFEIYSDNPDYLIRHVQGAQSFTELNKILERTMVLKYGEPLIIYNNVQELRQLISDIKANKKGVDSLSLKFPINELIDTVSRLKKEQKDEEQRVKDKLAYLAAAA